MSFKYGPVTLSVFVLAIACTLYNFTQSAIEAEHINEAKPCRSQGIPKILNSHVLPISILDKR